MRQLKSILRPKAWREREQDEEVHSYRPLKQAFVQLHITSDDINLFPNFSRPTIPQRKSSQRNTWSNAGLEAHQRQAGTYAFDEVPKLTKTPWELERSQQPASQRSRNADGQVSKFPARYFEQLPREIYHCILEHVRELHCSGSNVDVSGLQKNLRMLCVVDRRWHRVAREHLYRELWLSSSGPPPKKILPFPRGKGRLELLFRTLSEAPGLASLVRQLRVTNILALQLRVEADCQDIVRTLTEIIQQCTLLENLSGFAPSVSKEYLGFHSILSSRANLKACAWPFNKLYGQVLHSKASPACPSWAHLQTLVLWSTPAMNPTMAPGAISAFFHRLPSLKHLMLASFPKEDFHNGTLLTLPPLTSLRLQHLEGVTDQGVEQLAKSRMIMSLVSLTLVGLELSSIRSIQALLNNAVYLRRFKLAQEISPEPLFGTMVKTDRPLLASPSLVYLHWHAALPGQATSLLASSIRNGGFPQLKTIKAPSDYEGQLQSLCRPISRRPITSHDLAMIDFEGAEYYTRPLEVSRIHAQLRVRESRQQPAFNVIVQDEENEVQRTHVIGSYLGDLKSSIEYSLEPDVEGSNQALSVLEEVLQPHILQPCEGTMARYERAVDLRILL